MRKAIFLALFFAFCAPMAFSQGDIQRGEFGVMYSHNRVDTDGAFSNDPNDTGRDGFNGVNIDAGYNFSRYVGVKGDFSYHRKSSDVGIITAPPSNTTINVEGKLTQFMGGIKIQDNAMETRVRPFAQFLVGVGRAEVEASGTGIGAGFNSSETGFAAAVGGGLDFRVHRNVDIRAIKIEYNPVRIEGSTDNNIRIGVGLNFRF